ncbi:hypothetical protein [Spirosoma sordidisoli]|uniref:Uncharacterized protein n=1 Tax=Spirosoma sordidisoli TaxID=2502893 RepID=A0A4V1RWD0_9BACT|nr:hypothetical protein [Spirosoma sordidisoli]RYC69838.1 hypothetical protein EQG79_14690 [Spirosoma sordidisoli]
MYNNLADFFVAHQVDHLLETAHQGLTKAERWQLIDQLDQATDQYQRWKQRLQPSQIAHQLLTQKLRAIRLKRFQVWNSFYPAMSTAIKIGIHAA